MKNKRVPESQGFDVIVWKKVELSPTWACGYTKAGTIYLKTYNPDYVQGRAMDLKGTFPQEFYSNAPAGLRIGVTLGIKISAVAMHRPALQ